MCGDGVCGSDESALECPMDCCPLINNATCGNTYKCTPECCGEPTCCNSTSTDSGVLKRPEQMIILATVITAIVILTGNLLFQ